MSDYHLHFTASGSVCGDVSGWTEMEDGYELRTKVGTYSELLHIVEALDPEHLYVCGAAIPGFCPADEVHEILRMMGLPLFFSNSLIPHGTLPHRSSPQLRDLGRGYFYRTEDAAELRNWLSSPKIIAIMTYLDVLPSARRSFLSGEHDYVLHRFVAWLKEQPGGTALLLSEQF